MSKLLMQTLLPAALLLVSLQTALAAEPDWSLEKSAQGINVYTAHTEKTSHLAFRAESVIPGRSVNDVLTVIKDVPGLVNWLHTCYEAEQVALEGDAVQIIYMKNESPALLVSERDMVLRMEIQRQTADKAAVILTGVPERLPAKKDFVRIPMFEGGWTLENVGNDVKVVYSAVMDPGGSVPAAVSNMMVVKMPFETVRKLSDVVSKKPREG